jgi:aryl-alcohol dehydrogenase-like predicted oxidoreductase
MALTTVLGTMYYGTRTEEATAMRLLDRFVDRGGEWLDTANCYSFWSDPSGVGGQSEELLGRWLARRPGMRDRVRIATKVRHQPMVPHVWPSSAEGLSAPAIASGIEASLKRLDIDYLDLYWAHADDRTVPLEETVGAFGKLVGAGLVRRLGASNHHTWRLERARAVARTLGVPGYSAVQLRRSYVHPRPGASLPDSGHMLASEEALDYVAADPELTMWAYTPLVNGSYGRSDRPFPEAYDHPGTTRRLAALAEVAEQVGATRNQVVLAWLAQGTPAIAPIVGVSTVEQLDEALDAERLRLSPDQMSQLDSAA